MEQQINSASLDKLKKQEANRFLLFQLYSHECEGAFTNSISISPLFADTFSVFSPPVLLGRLLSPFLTLELIAKSS